MLKLNYFIPIPNVFIAYTPILIFYIYYYYYFLCLFPFKGRLSYILLRTSKKKTTGCLYIYRVGISRPIFHINNCIKYTRTNLFFFNKSVNTSKLLLIRSYTSVKLPLKVNLFTITFSRPCSTSFISGFIWQDPSDTFKQLQAPPNVCLYTVLYTLPYCCLIERHKPSVTKHKILPLRRVTWPHSEVLAPRFSTERNYHYRLIPYMVSRNQLWPMGWLNVTYHE